MMIIGQTVKTLISRYRSDNNLLENQDITNLQKKIDAIIETWLKDHSIHYLINSHPLNLYEGTQEL